MNRWWVRLGLVIAGTCIMAWEGSVQPSPGVGFAVALGLFGVAALAGAETDWWKCYKGDEE